MYVHCCCIVAALLRLPCSRACFALSISSVNKLVTPPESKLLEHYDNIYFGGQNALHYFIRAMLQNGVLHGATNQRAASELFVVNLKESLGGAGTKTEVCACANGINVTQLTVMGIEDELSVCAVPVLDRFVVPEVIAARGRGAVIYIHCHAGVNRAPTGVSAFLLQSFPDLDFQSAIGIIKSSRPPAFHGECPTNNFQAQLMSFYRSGVDDALAVPIARRVATRSTAPSVPFVALPSTDDAKTEDWSELGSNADRQPHSSTGCVLEYCSYMCGGDGVIHHARATACAKILQSVCDVTLHRMNDSMSTSGFESLNGLCRGSSNVASIIWPRLLVAVASSVLTDHRVVFTARASGLASKQSSDGARAADAYFRGKKGCEWLVRQPTVCGDEQASATDNLREA